MKYNVKKKNSTLEVTIKLEEHHAATAKKNQVPRVMITPRKIIELLVKDGHQPGVLLDNGGRSSISNARWQDAFKLKTVWVFEDTSISKVKTQAVKTQAVKTQAVKTQTSNKTKKQK